MFFFQRVKMAPKKFRALEMKCLQMEDRMMLEEEIDMLKAIIVPLPVPVPLY